MPRRQILSSEEQERLLVIPDDEIILTRMCFLNEPDIALINKHRRPANRLGFAVLLCYLRGPGFIPDKSSPPHNGVVSRVASRLKLQPDLWPEYASREQTRWEHLTEQDRAATKILMIISSRLLSLRNPDIMTSYSWPFRPIARHTFRPV